MAGSNRRCYPRANAEHQQNADPNDGSHDGRLGGADQITDDRFPVGDAVEVKVLAQRQPGRHLGKRRRFANGGDQSHTVLDTSRGAMAENLVRRDVVLGKGWQAQMACDGTEVDKSSGAMAVAGSGAPASPQRNWQVGIQEWEGIMTEKLTLKHLQDAVRGSAAAFRCRRRLQPAG